MTTEDVVYSEVEVVANLLEPIEEETDYHSLQQQINHLMSTYGYTTTTHERVARGAATAEYVYSKHWGSDNGDNGGFLERIFGASQGESSNRNMYTKHLAGLAYDTPDIIHFRFYPVNIDEENYIRINIRIEPAMVGQHRLLDAKPQYNESNAISKAKDLVLDLACERIWQLERGPYSRTQVSVQTITEGDREIIQESEYGHNVLTFIDEGDEALKEELLHAALATFILAIEWSIISYLEYEYDRDLFEEAGGVDEFEYRDYVDRIREHNDISGIVLENLGKHQADRRIMAHSKDGYLRRSQVEDVRTTLEELISETFGSP